MVLVTLISQRQGQDVPDSTTSIRVEKRNVGQEPPVPTPTIEMSPHIGKQVLYAAVDDHAIQVSKRDHNTVRDLISDLIYSKNIIDELERVRVIFRWLASKNLKEMSFIDVQPGSPEELLMELKTGKTSYARVFDTMCRCAELNSEIISGYKKSYGYLTGQTFKPGQDKHSWNAVKISGKMCLFDANWGARKQNTDENFRYELEEYYFLTDPAQLIYSHLPLDPKWQLLDNSVTLDQFENMPRVLAKFFKCGLELVSHRTAVVHGRGEINIRLGYPAHRLVYAFTVSVQFENGDKEYNGVKLNRYVMHENVRGVASFRLRLPKNGSYFLNIYSKENSLANKDNAYEGVCEYKIVQEEVAAQQPEPFPPCADRQWGPGPNFLSYGLETEQKTASVCTRDGKVELQFKVPTATRFKAKLKHNRISDSELGGYCMYRIVGNTAFVNINAPARGEYGLEIYAKDPTTEGKSLFHVAQYIIECNEDVKAEPLPELPGGYLGEQPKYSQFGVNTLSHHHPLIELEKNSVEIQLSFAQEMRVEAILIDAESNEDYPDFVFTQTQGSVISIDVVLPNKGFYKLQLYSKPTSDMSNDLDGIFNYLIKCKKVTQQVHPFPKQYAEWKLGCYLETPLSLHRDCGDEVLFRVFVPNASAVAVIAGDEWTYMHATQPSIWEGNVKLGSVYGRGEKVTVSAKYDGNTESYLLLEYNI